MLLTKNEKRVNEIARALEDLGRSEGWNLLLSIAESKMAEYGRKYAEKGHSEEFRVLAASYAGLSKVLDDAKATAESFIIDDEDEE